MSALSEIAKRLAYLGDAQLQLADKPGVFQLPRHLGTTPQEIVANASTAKVPLSLYMPHEIAAKRDYLDQHARNVAENYVKNTIVPNFKTKHGVDLSPADVQAKIDDAHQNIMAQYHNVNLFGNDENHIIATPNGWLSIGTPDLSDPSRTVIDAINLNSEGKQGGGGTPAYQAALSIIKNGGYSNYTKDLTPINAFRKAQQLLSHGAREGDLSHIEVDPRQFYSTNLAVVPTKQQFSELDTPAKLGYLSSITQAVTDDALKHNLRGAPLPGGLNDLMQDSRHTPYLLGSDYRDIDPDTLKSILSQTGPGSGVGSAALRQGMLTHSLNGMYDLSGDVAAPDVSRFNDDFTQGLMYAEGGSVTAEPTEAQKAAGNYKKERTMFNGLPISIENAKGSVRRGTDPDGKAWAVTMPAHYGYIRRTEGADGDHVDAYLGEDHEAPRAYVVDQVDPDTRQFDEHKVLLGFPSARHAMATYYAGFSDGRGAERLGAIMPMEHDELKAWLKDGDTTAPVAYKPPVNLAVGGSVPHEGMEHAPGPKLLDTQGVRDYLQRHLLHPVDTMIQNTNQARQDMISDPVNAGLNFV